MSLWPTRWRRGWRLRARGQTSTLSRRCSSWPPTDMPLPTVRRRAGALPSPCGRPHHGRVAHGPALVLYERARTTGSVRRPTLVTLNLLLRLCALTGRADVARRVRPHPCNLMAGKGVCVLRRTVGGGTAGGRGHARAAAGPGRHLVHGPRGRLSVRRGVPASTSASGRPAASEAASIGGGGGRVDTTGWQDRWLRCISSG
jgi:hypothetical protein